MTAQGFEALLPRPCGRSPAALPERPSRRDVFDGFDLEGQTGNGRSP